MSTLCICHHRGVCRSKQRPGSILSNIPFDRVVYAANIFVVAEAVPCIRMRMGELGIAIVNANDEMGSRKWYSVADVLGKIDLSDDECFYDNYIDRESENDLHDDEPPSDADSNATEDYTPPAAAAAADAGHISHPDSEHGDGDA